MVAGLVPLLREVVRTDDADSNGLVSTKIFFFQTALLLVTTRDGASTSNRG
jgi:hypothetical protein